MQGILFSFLSEYGPLFLEGLVTTLILAFVGTIVGFFLGLFLALARNIKKNPTDTKMKILLKSSGYILSTIYVQFFSRHSDDGSSDYFIFWKLGRRF